MSRSFSERWAARGADPSEGARRRETLLLVGYLLVVLAGVWVVVVAELGGTEEPAASGLTAPATPANAK